MEEGIKECSSIHSKNRQGQKWRSFGLGWNLTREDIDRWGWFSTDKWRFETRLVVVSIIEGRLRSFRTTLFLTNQEIESEHPRLSMFGLIRSFTIVEKWPELVVRSFYFGMRVLIFFSRKTLYWRLLLGTWLIQSRQFFCRSYEDPVDVCSFWKMDSDFDSLILGTYSEYHVWKERRWFLNKTVTCEMTFSE